MPQKHQELTDALLQHRLSRRELDQILSNAITQDDVLSNDDFENTGDNSSDGDVSDMELAIDEENRHLLNEHYALLKNQYTDYRGSEKATEYLDVESDSDVLEDKQSKSLPSRSLPHNAKSQTPDRLVPEKSTQRQSAKRLVPKNSIYIALLKLVSFVLLGVSAGALFSIFTNNRGNNSAEHLFLWERSNHQIMPQFNQSVLPSSVYSLLPENVTGHLIDTFKHIYHSINYLNDKIENAQQGQNIEEIASKLNDISALIENLRSENEISFMTVEQKFDQSIEDVYEKVSNLSEQIKQVDLEVQELNEFKVSASKSLKTLTSRVNQPNSDIKKYLDEVLPKYLPVTVNAQGGLAILPYFEKELKTLIGSYVKAAVNKSTNLTFAQQQNLEPDNKMLETYLSDYITKNNILDFVNLKDSKIAEFVQEQITKSLPSLIDNKIETIIKTHQQSQGTNTRTTAGLTKDDNDRLIIDSTTELVLSKLIQKLISQDGTKTSKKYNFAEYENGARIVPELVSTFDSFNTTDLYIRQKQQSLRKVKQLLGIKPAIDYKIGDKNLVLNTYQVILPNSAVVKDNYPNIKGQKTGIKTIAVKFSQPIYLSDLIISYSRFEQNAQTLYSAPQKIGIWIQLGNPQADLPKLKKYLYETTKEAYKDKYVVDVEKLQEEILQDEVSKKKRPSGSSSPIPEQDFNGHHEAAHSDEDIPKSKIPIKRLKTVDEEYYEKFYELNFKLFRNNYVKVGNMIYDISPSAPDDQKVPVINENFKNLKISITSIFFSIESNYGDEFVTNLFKVKAFGVSDFDLFCMKELLFGKSDMQARKSNISTVQSEEDFIRLEKLFKEKYVRELGDDDNGEPIKGRDDDGSDDEEGRYVNYVDAVGDNGSDVGYF